MAKSKPTANKNLLPPTATASKYLQTYATKPVKIPKYSHPEYKHCLDDALALLLNTDHAYSQSHFLTDVKMALGYIACTFAAYGSYESYTKPFNTTEVQVKLVICVIGFFLFQGLMIGWSWGVEKDVVYEGSRGGSGKLVVETKSPFLTNGYEVKVSVVGGGSVAVKKEFGGWFKADGTFCADVFKKEFEGLLKKCEGLH